MILQLFSIYDEVTLIYNYPFIAHNINDAKRMFISSTQDENSMISKNPQDFSLYYVGSYNNENGEYTNTFPKELVLRGNQINITKEV